MARPCAFLLMAASLAWAVAGAPAQQPAAAPPAQFGLAQAVATAWARYPGMAAARQAALGAGAEAEQARLAAQPTLGVAAQWDRATDNATLGLSFASPLPGISGTVPLSDYSQRSAWTSAAGLYFSWEIADFGRRAANLRYWRDLAAAAGDRADLVQLQVGAHAADAYLNVLAARQLVRVTQADVARWQGVDGIIQALVAQQLRPGADASRAQAELAAARLRAANASRDLALAQANLSEALGWPAGQPLPALAPLPASPPSTSLPSAAVAVQPELRVAADQLAAATARQKEMARQGLPRWYALGSAYGRGTGVLAPGRFADGLSGLAPTTAANWAVGVGMDFSLTRWRTAHAQQAAAAAQLGVQQARQRQVTAALAAAQARARADSEAARTAAQLAPVGLAAAQATEAQARVRYQTGLTSVVELANAEQLLAQADSDSALSRLQLWRALVESAYAAGGLQPLLDAAQGK